MKRGSRSFDEQARAVLRTRLEARRPELEQAVLTRVYAISDPAAAIDPTYAEGLRAAVSAALDYGLAGLVDGEKRGAVPLALLSQARLAARSSVSLDTVLRRYFAGYTLLGDFLIEEASEGDLGGAELKRLLRAQATLFDRLLAAVSEEYTREAECRPGSFEQRRVQRIERLLAGELIDASELGYDLDTYNLGAIAVGRGAEAALRSTAQLLDCVILLVQQPGEVVWAWFGGRRRPDPADLDAYLSSSWPAQISLALGEPAEGLAGWRLSHRQAAAALPIALRGSESVVRYTDVALLASILQDDLLVTSLRQLYLAPLEQERDGGEAARETLRAYYGADRNVSSAAAALGVNRNTVASRLRTIEEGLGRSLASVAAELEAALRLEELSDPATPPVPWQPAGSPVLR